MLFQFDSDTKANTHAIRKAFYSKFISYIFWTERHNEKLKTPLERAHLNLSKEIYITCKIFLGLGILDYIGRI